MNSKRTTCTDLMWRTRISTRDERDFSLIRGQSLRFLIRLSCRRKSADKKSNTLKNTCRRSATDLRTTSAESWVSAISKLIPTCQLLRTDPVDGNTARTSQGPPMYYVSFPPLLLVTPTKWVLFC